MAEWFSTRSPVDSVGVIDPIAVVLLSIALLLACSLTTRLRWTALPFALAGFALCLTSVRPALFIAEDALLVGSPTNGGIAVNRNRPNAFTMKNWLHAAARDDIVKPLKLEGNALQHLDQARGSAFRCAGSTCIAVSSVGVVITAFDGKTAAEYCDIAQFIVVADATAGIVCREGSAVVITRRDLARRGTAAVTGDELAFAIAEPYRPWHAHRQYSREARGLAPWKPAEEPASRGQLSKEDSKDQSSRRMLDQQTR